MLVFWVTLSGLVTLGGHALVPAWLARAADRRRAWALAALPLALATGVLELRRLAARPDELLAAAPITAPIALRVAGITWLALLLADTLLVFGWRRLEPAGWRVLAGFGWVALVVGSGLEEISRVGRDPSVTIVGLLIATGCRTLVGWAAGAALLPRRPWSSLIGALALVAHALFLPAPIAAALLARGWWTTLAAAGLALGSAPWVPLRLRRPAAIAGVLLAALWFAGVAIVAAELPLASGAAPPLLPR